MKTCVINQKGGTAKTTTSIHLAAGLAQRGIKTLLIDNDPQGSVAVSLGFKPQGLAEILLGETSFQEAVQAAEKNLLLLTTNMRLLEVEHMLHQDPEKRKTLFAERLGELRDYRVIIDMAPSRSRMNEAALFYCNEVLIPVSCDYLALVGVRDILEFVDKLSTQKEEPIKLHGVLPTLYDRRSKSAREACELLRTHFPEKLYPPIRMSTKAKEAPSHRKTIFDYSQTSSTSQDYKSFSEHFLENDTAH
jgi:chromosome partitioning protein